MSASFATDVELVTFRPTVDRAVRFFRTMGTAGASAGVRVTRSETYQGLGRWLMFWGPGDPARAAAMQQHVARGGRAIAWDLGYWQRDVAMRVSIDAAHPSAWVMRRDWPVSRLRAAHVTVADHWQPTGPIVVAGLGDKARVQYGAAAVDAWELSMAQACQARWPGRRIVYRKKRATASAPAWAATVSSGATPIEGVLTGASLVITWHSNVAVDAIRLGIPVICRDGAAAAVCPSTLGNDDPQPLAPDLRQRFLANLAWFQWTPNEAPQCWTFLRELLA